MRVTITTRYEKHKPTTMGYSVSLITTYTSTRREKIDEVVDMLRNSIHGSILITEVSDKLQGEEDAN